MESQRGSGERAVSLVATAGVCVSLAGCGGSTAPEPAAEPAGSPPTTTRPAGIVRTIGAQPEGLIFQRRSNKLAVALRDPDRLGFVEPRRLFIKREYALPAPARHLTLSASGRRVIVPSESANRVLEISLKRGVVSDVATGEHPHDATPADGKVFVADEFGDTVSVIEGDRVSATLSAPEQPGGIAATPSGYVALITVAERVLQVYDAAGGEALGQTSAGDGPTHIETDGDYAYVADTDGDKIRKYLIGPEPEEVATVAAAGTPYGIAIDPGRRRLWVTLTATNRVAAYSIAGETPRRIATFPTIRQPNTVAVDPVSGNIFIASRSNATLQRISPRIGQ